jgi:membrane-associated protein
MEYIIKLLGLVSHINTVIQNLVNSGSNWAYTVIFLIMFSGAAFIFAAPILPSVSLIFLITSLSIAGLLNPLLAYFVSTAAIVIGDLSAYLLGRLIRSKVIDTHRLPFFKAEHFDKTKKIYDRADFFSIVFARFTPVVGSFAQFVAGTINFEFQAFVKRNVIAGVIWMTIYFVLGLLFAAIPTLGRNFVLMFFIVPLFSAVVSIGYYIFRNLDVINAIRQKRSILHER